MENKKNEDNEVSRRMWKAVETKAGKTGMAKVEKKKEKKKRSRKKRKERKESGGEVWDLGWEERGSKIWRRGQEIGISKVPQMDPFFWKESEWEDANEEDVGLCNRIERRIYTIEKENLSLIQRREGEVHEFINEQLRKGYIMPWKLSQIAQVFFVKIKIYSLAALILSFSIWTSPCPTTTSRIDISSTLKSYFDCLK